MIEEKNPLRTVDIRVGIAVLSQYHDQMTLGVKAENCYTWCTFLC